MPNLVPPWIRYSVGVLLIIVLILFALDKGYTLKQTFSHANPKNTISVSADGKVAAAPDLATVDIGVYSTASTASDAQDQSTKKINSIIDFVKKQGIDSKDITTSQFNLFPQQDYRSGQPVVIGYSANQSVTIKVHGVDKSTDTLSKVLGGVTTAGANQVNGVSLSFEDPDNLRQQAREQAIGKAKEKAQALAQSAGLSLGRVVNVSESGSGFPTPIPYAAGMGGIAADTKAVPPIIETGNQDITVTMTVVYEVK